MSDNDIFQGGSEPREHYVYNFGHFEAFSALINHNYNPIFNFTKYKYNPVFTKYKNPTFKSKM